MDDLLIGVIAAIAEALLEAGLQIAVEILVSLFTRVISKPFAESPNVNPVATALGVGLLGAFLGFLSVVAYPHALMHPSRLHGVSLIVSPLITGFLMSQLGCLWRRHGRKAVPIESFGYGAGFAFAMALVRFLMLR